MLYCLETYGYKMFYTIGLHNKMVQAAIVSEIVNQPNTKVKAETAKGYLFPLSLCYLSVYYIVAVKQCYENLRRTYLEQQENKLEFSESQSQRRKYRSRRSRVRLVLH